MNVYDGLFLNVRPSAGCHISQVCKAAQALADFTKHSVILNFNGVELMAEWNTTATELESEYYKEIK